MDGLNKTLHLLCRTQNPIFQYFIDLFLQHKVLWGMSKPVNVWIMEIIRSSSPISFGLPRKVLLLFLIC